MRCFRYRFAIRSAHRPPRSKTTRAIVKGSPVEVSGLPHGITIHTRDHVEQSSSSNGDPQTHTELRRGIPALGVHSRKRAVGKTFFASHNLLSCHCKMRLQAPKFRIRARLLGSSTEDGFEDNGFSPEVRSWGVRAFSAAPLSGVDLVSKETTCAASIRSSVIGLAKKHPTTYIFT